MLYFVFATGRCNIACTYCGGSLPDAMMPAEVEYDVDALRRLVAQDDDATVAFYGGEPLLRIPLIRDLMQRVPAKRFVLQTNGTLVHALPDDCLGRLDTILVSLDGRPETTDASRGAGLHARVMASVARMRPRFRGDLVARMTVGERTDIEHDVEHLLASGFDHVHWQLNAVWSPEGSWTDFERWIEERYNPGITRLARRWVAELENGRVGGIVPFQGVMGRLLWGASPMPCGAGRDAFAVTTDGWVLACPIGPEYEWNQVARLDAASPEAIRDHLDVVEPCRSCDVAAVCGGRCLFANRERASNPVEFDLVCRTVKHLVREMEAARPAVERLLADGVLSKAALRYPSFNNTTEIIP